MDKTDPDRIAQAAGLLEQGRLVAFPTETVYGLGADAENPRAVAAIYEAKGRPSDHPVIVHVAAGADLAHWAQDVPPEAFKLVQAFWPGPLTLILKRAAGIPAAVSGGQDTVGLRSPAHPVAQALLQAFKGGRGGVAAPSANRFGRVSPTTAQHVIDEFGAPPEGPLAAVLDGGASEVGIESTIVDMSRMATHGPVLLRPGRVTPQQIEAVIGVAPAAPDKAAPRASGTLEAHYAPVAPVVLLAAADVAPWIAKLSARGRRAALLRRSRGGAAFPHEVVVREMQPEPDEYARQLYAALRALDRERPEVIIVESPPASPDWAGVNDRLRRAAFGSVGVLQKLAG